MRLRTLALLSASVGAVVGAGVALLASRQDAARVRVPQARSDDPTLIPMSTVERMMDRFGEVVRETVSAIVNPQNAKPTPIFDMEQVRREAERLVDAGVTIPDWAAENPAQPEFRDPTNLDQPLDNYGMVGDQLIWEGGPVEFPVGGFNSGGNGSAEMIRPGDNPFTDLGLPPTPPTLPGADT